MRYKLGEISKLSHFKYQRSIILTVNISLKQPLLVVIGTQIFLRRVRVHV